MTGSVHSDEGERSTAANGPVWAVLVGAFACGLAAVTPNSWWFRAIGGAIDPAVQSGIVLARVTSSCVALALLAVAWLYRRSGSLVGPWLSHLLVDAGIMVIGYDLLFVRG